MGTSRYTVAPGKELNYPANDLSAKIIKNAGGRSKLTPELKAMVKFKHAKEGDDPSDMPDKELFAEYISRGYIIDKEAPIEEPEFLALLAEESN